VLYVRIIVGIALLLMAAFGPGIGVRPNTRQRRGADAIQPANAPHDRVGRRDQRMATVFILRIGATMLGLWLLIYSISQLLHQGHASPH
jgi:hypothetical protein